MKTKKIIALLILVGQFVFAQEPTLPPATPAVGEEIYSLTGVETRPEFRGGLSGFYQYISDNYKLPKTKNLRGKVYTTFIIEKDGSLTNIKVLRDIGHGTGDEALRVLENSPKWVPAKQNGQPVRVLYSLPLTISTE